jgi:hypothetical protein
MGTIRPEPARAAKAIIKHLALIADTGHTPHNVFRDWLAVAEATLRMRPTHERSLRQHGTPADDPPDVVEVWETVRRRYTTAAFEHFTNALGELLQHAQQNLRAGELDDIVGNLYESWGYPNTGMGQYFTPFDLAQVMAQMTVDPNAVNARLKSAIAQSTLASAMLMAGSWLHGDEAFAWYIARVIPAAIEHYEPVTIYEPCCGSGTMLLAAASCFPAWMPQMGLVQLFGQDLDPICVLMCKINLMLYQLNGGGMETMLRWAEGVLARKGELPPPEPSHIERNTTADVLEQSSIFDMEQA